MMNTPINTTAATSPGSAVIPDVLPLSAPAACDPARAGGKAARVAALLQMGHPVPAGFVITTAAGREFASIHGLDGASPPDRVASAAIPAGLADGIGRALLDLGEGPSQCARPRSRRI